MTIEWVDVEPKRDRFGRALIVPECGGKPKAHTRATTVAETLDDRWALEKWGKRQVALGLAVRPDLIAQVAAHTAADKKQLDDVCKQALDAAASSAAANTGTALHRILERVNRGELAVDDVPEQFRERVEATLTALAAAGLQPAPAYVERHCVVPDLVVSGTFDFLGSEATGSPLTVCDYKTGSTVDYGGPAFATQLALYAHAATLYDFATETHQPMPDVRRDYGLIVHVPASGGDVTIHEVDLTAGWEAVAHAMWVRTWRKAKPIRRRDVALATERVVEAFPGAEVVSASTASGVVYVDTPADTTITVSGVTNIPSLHPPVERPDDGPPIDLEATKAQIVAAIGGDVTVEADLKRWVAEGKAAGRSWRITDHPTTRCRQLYRAAVRLSRWASDDDDVRTAIGVVLGDADVPPSVPVGKALGALTLDEATRLIDVATALGGGAALHFDDDGTARVA